jgi:glycopeptide antibiotics resistance protein
MGETSPDAGQFPGTDAARQHLGVAPRDRNGRQALPSKSTARLLWALFSAFVVYGTTFPFRFNLDWRRFLSETHRINWLPLGGEPGNPMIADIIQNILLFIPFGFLGYFSLIYKSSLANKIKIVLAGAALSASVEFLQIFSPQRFPSLSDVIFNTLGTAVGLALGVVLKKSVLGFKSNPHARRFLNAESAFPAFVFLVLVVGGCLEPFDFSLDVGVVWSHVKPLATDPVRFSLVDDDLIHFTRFLLATLFVCRLAREAGLRRPAGLGASLMAALALGLELSQIFVQSRMPEAQDVLVAWAGVLAGIVAYRFPPFHRHPVPWMVAGAFAVFVSAAAHAFYPYELSSRYSGFNWVLFLPQYEQTTFAALSDFVENAMVFFPIGFLWAYFFPRSRSVLWAGLAAGGLSLLLELGQGYAPGHYSDATDVLGSILGAMAGGLAIRRGWPAFRDYLREDKDDQV